MPRSESARLSTRAKGNRFEKRVEAQLEAIGLYVIRSEKSRGVADLVAIGPDTKPLLFVQCKAHCFTPPTKEWNALYTEAKRRGALAIWARLNGDDVETYRLKGLKDPPPADSWPWERVTIEAAN